MNYYTIAPPAALAGYVRCFWVLEGDGPYIHRSMADGCAELVFHYKASFDEICRTGHTESSFSAGLSGPSQVYRRYATSTDFGIFGVYLYPYAIPQFFSIPAEELSNQTPDCHTLLGLPGKLLAERIFAAKNNPERVKISSAFFEKQLYRHAQKEQGIISVVNSIINSGGTAPVDTLAKNSFLSIRQFERKFKAFSGFSPKLYSRIIRFQSALRQYGNQQLTLTDIAYDCGYYDQSHFIHDFREFSGFHPKQYFNCNNEGNAWKESMQM